MSGGASSSAPPASVPAAGPRDRFDYLSPLDTRYYGDSDAVFAALHPYLSETATLRYQLRVETTLLETLEALGIAPAGIGRRAAEAAAQVAPAEIAEEERRTQHNIRALVNCLQRRLPAADRGYVHLFATSADIMDTARALALREFTEESLSPRLRDVAAVLVGMAREHAATPQIGRTHGRHAEPITVGYWLANFLIRLVQRIEAVEAAAKGLRGMFSGAVGARSALALRWPDDPAAIERQILGRLGLEPGAGSASTQIVQPEYLCDYGHALVSTLGVLAHIADDVRHLMRSEIEELREPLDPHQVGSSTMPHKINPRNFENVKSLWKAFMPRMATLYMDQISEHQRDLTNSASTRFFGELAAATWYAAHRMRLALGRIELDREALARNLGAAKATIVAEPLYIAFALAGHSDPYYLLRKLVARGREEKRDLLALVESDPQAKALWKGLPQAQKDAILDPTRYVGDCAKRTLAICEEAEARLAQKNIAVPAKAGTPANAGKPLIGRSIPAAEMGPRPPRGPTQRSG